MNVRLDRFTRAERSFVMSRVGHFDTAPEKAVRRLLHGLGYRFRLHPRDLPGRPDIVMPRHRKAVFVHGCFWHGHANCSRAARPVANSEFWDAKITRNIARDQSAQQALITMGWRPVVVWECELRNVDNLTQRLIHFMKQTRDLPLRGAQSRARSWASRKARKRSSRPE